MKLILPVCLAAIAAIIVVGCTQGRFNVAFVDGTVALADSIDMSAWSEYTKLLRQRYQIGSKVFSLPAYPHAVEAWVRGYNEVASPRIERKFGIGVLERTKADAQKLANVNGHVHISKL